MSHSDARDIALGSLLLIMATSCALIGALGGLLHLVTTGEYPINLLLTTGAALALLLAGLALLALINQWRRSRYLAGGLMVLLGLYPLIHNAWASPGDEVLSCSPAICVWIRYRRRCWR